MENNIVNVYGYIRVSTEGQVKQGYSLAEQCAEIEKYCSSKSYNLVEIFKDEGISGAKANEDEMSIERGGQTWSKFCYIGNLKRTMSISEQSTDRIILSTLKILMRFL